MVFHDVSRRRKIDRALRANEERLRAMFTQAAVGIAVASARRTLSGSERQVLPRSSAIRSTNCANALSSEVTHPDDVQLTEDFMRQLLAGEIESYACEKRYVRKDGSVVWSSTTVTLLQKGRRRAAQFIGIVEDITERKQADVLRSRLAAVVESSDDAIISKTLDGIITTWNPGAQRVFGYAAEEVIGKSITLLIPPELHGRGARHPRAAAQSANASITTRPRACARTASASMCR